MEANKKYDAIVIGAGNGGLTAANQLAMNGKRVLLIEQHNLPGGVATSFVRGRFEFETSLHELCDVGDEQDPGNIRKMFEKFGVPINWVSIPDVFRVIGTYSDGTPMDVTMPKGMENFIKCMEKTVPGCEESLRNLIDVCDQIVEAVAFIDTHGRKNQKEIIKRYPDFLTFSSYSASQCFEALHMPQKARDILSTYWGYLGVSMDETIMVHYVIMVYLYVKRGAYIPALTSHELSLGLLESFRRFGGDILMSTKATRILFDKRKRVTGVETTNGIFETNQVIFNGNPTMAFATMIPENVVPKKQYQLANAREFSARPFVIYMGLDCTYHDLGMENYCLFFPTTMDSTQEYINLCNFKTNEYIISTCPNVVNPKASPEGTCILSLTSMFFSNCWDEINPGDYNSIKEEFADKMISVFESKSGMKIREHIEEISIATPWTFHRYTSVPEGAVYGYENQMWDSILARNMMQSKDFPIKGFKYCGATGLKGNGYGSAYEDGVRVADIVLKELK